MLKTPNFIVNNEINKLNLVNTETLNFKINGVQKTVNDLRMECHDNFARMELKIEKLRNESTSNIEKLRNETSDNLKNLEIKMVKLHNEYKDDIEKLRSEDRINFEKINSNFYKLSNKIMIVMFTWFILYFIALIHFF